MDRRSFDGGEEGGDHLVVPGRAQLIPAPSVERCPGPHRPDGAPAVDDRPVFVVGDPDLFERYRYRIPVIVVDGVERLEGRIEPAEVGALVLP